MGLYLLAIRQLHTSSGRKWNFSVPVKNRKQAGAGGQNRDCEGHINPWNYCHWLQQGWAGGGTSGHCKYSCCCLKVWWVTKSCCFPQCFLPDSGERGMLNMDFPSSHEVFLGWAIPIPAFVAVPAVFDPGTSSSSFLSLHGIFQKTPQLLSILCTYPCTNRV